MQNILVFDILMGLILLSLFYLRFHSGMSDRPRFSFKQHKHHFKASFDCFIKVTCNININNFGLHLKCFTLLTVYILLFLTDKLFADVSQKHFLTIELTNKFESLYTFHLHSQSIFLSFSQLYIVIVTGIIDYYCHFQVI